MRVLLDECVPRKLQRELPEYEVRTVVEAGWSGKKNGQLHYDVAEFQEDLRTLQELGRL